MPPEEKIPVELAGVPETLLWPLGMRARESQANPAFFSDPMSVELAERIDADFAMFGKPNHWHAVRAKYSDSLLRDYLGKHADATVVSLGEGLDTQFWRVDNGRVTWVSIDLPEAIELRRRLLPSETRMVTVEASAFDPRWMDGVDGSRGLFILAQGLFMYFEQAQVIALLSRIGERFGDLDAELFFDTIPPWLSRRSTDKGWRTTKRYRIPPVPFGIRPSELGDFAAQIPGLGIVKSLLYPKAFPERHRLWSLIASLPWLSNNGPLLVHARFR